MYKRLGRSIRIDRLKKFYGSNKSSWTQQDLCEGICSHSTLIRIEKGQKARYEETYMELCEKLGYKFYAKDVVDTIDESLGIIEVKLVEAVDERNDEVVIELLKKYRKALLLCKGMIVYSQTLEVVEVLLNYFENRVFHIPYFEVYAIGLLDVISCRLASIFRVYLYMYFYYTKADEKYKFYVQQLDIAKDDRMFVKMTYAHYLLIHKDSRFLETFEEVYNYYRTTNSIRKNEILSLLYHYEEYFQEPLPIHMKHLMEQELSNDQSWVVNMNRKAFEKIHIDEEVLPTIQFYFQKKMIKEEIHNLLPVDRIGDDSYQVLYQYEQLPDNPKVKQDYLMNTVLRELEGKEPVYWSYFFEELHLLCKETRRYKDQHIFYEKMKRDFSI